MGVEMVKQAMFLQWVKNDCDTQ